MSRGDCRCGQRFEAGSTILTRLVEKGRRSIVPVDDAHLTAEQIEQLRQGFNPGKSKGFANPCRLASPNWLHLIRIMEKSPELQHLKTATANPDAGLLDQNWAGALQADRQRDEQQQGRG